MSKIIDYTVYIVLIVILILIAYASYLVLSGGYIFSYGTGVSNQPLVDNGSVLVHNNVDSIDNVEEGDLVSFESDCFATSENILHMVIDKRNDGLITMGVNNSEPDQVVYFEQNSNVTTTDLNGIEDYYPVIDKMKVSERSCVGMVDDDNIRGINKFKSNNELLVSIVEELRDVRYNDTKLK